MRFAVTIIVISAALVGLACSGPEPAPAAAPTAAPASAPEPLPSPTSRPIPTPSPTVSLRDLVPPELIATTAPVPIATIQPPSSLPLANTATPSTGAGPLTIKSDAFANGTPIPIIFTCEGDDVSPPLSWSGVPDDTRSFALIVDDPDAPVGVFTHWVLYNLPDDTVDLPQGIAKTDRLDNGALQGQSDFRGDNIGYSGPCPPGGSVHRYRFNLYALDSPLDLEPGASKQQVIDAMQGHILDEALLLGLYRRGGN